MKKLLIPIVLTNIIWANCSSEQQAKELWQQSRDMYGMQKYQTLKKAYTLCNMDEIEIDTLLFTIDNELKDNELSLEKLNRLSKNLSEIRSLNNTLLSSVKSANGEEINRLDNKLVEREIKLETNNEKLEKLYAHKSSIGDKSKGIKVGKKIDVLIRFANGKDRVQSSRGVKRLIQEIEASLEENPNAKFTFTGYASSRGNAKRVNIPLSKRRAINTKRYIEQYIETGHVIAQGKGESKLICTKGRAKSLGNKEYHCSNGVENETASRRIEVLRRR